MSGNTDKSQGSSDESIGRPAPWREGRYQQPGKPLAPSVVAPTDEQHQAKDTISTPVTRKDYEHG
jgi:hypothetical protein